MQNSIRNKVPGRILSIIKKKYVRLSLTFKQKKRRNFVKIWTSRNRFIIELR